MKNFYLISDIEQLTSKQTQPQISMSCQAYQCQFNHNPTAQLQFPIARFLNDFQPPPSNRFPKKN